MSEAKITARTFCRKTSSGFASFGWHVLVDTSNIFNLHSFKGHPGFGEVGSTEMCEEHPISSVVVESTAKSARGIGIDPSDFCCTVVVNEANPRDLSESKVKLKKKSTDLLIFLPQFGVRSKVWDHTWICCEASCGPQIRQKTCGIAKRCFRLRRLRLWPSEAKTQVNAVFRQRWDMSDTSFKTSVLSLWVGKYRSRRINNKQ